MAQIKDVIGEVYSRYTIVENLPSIKYGKKYYKRVKARCECGNERELTYGDLKREKIKSCGCIGALNKVRVDIGEKFNYWTVLEENPYDKKKDGRNFNCQCICGKVGIVSSYSLRKEKSRSCGCNGKIPQEKIKKEKIIPQNTEEEQWKECINFKGYYISTLGRLFNYGIQYMFPSRYAYEIKGKSLNAVKEMYKTFIEDYDEKMFVIKGVIGKLELRHIESERKIRRVYTSMKSRCNNPNATSYEIYGGRGICIEKSFNTFDKFYYWSIENNFKLDEGLQIDRINNDGNYCAKNCRWTTHAENNRNTSRNVLTWEIVDKIRNGEYKDEDAHKVAKVIGCRVETIKSVLSFKTWVE